METATTSSATQKPKYGIDAPGVVRNLLVIGTSILILAIFFPVIHIVGNTIELRPFLGTGISLCLAGSFMLYYSLKGKFAHRDRMLNLINWTGHEHTLDVGTGKGLLMIGAAKRLTTGKSIGIDIWNAEDLSGNNYANAMKNAAIEGVEGKVEILNENAMQMSFANESFDAVFANLCIHNIYNAPGRNTACEEIARVLKKGVTAVIADFRHMREYRRNFNRLGLQTEMLGANYLTAFPPLKILVIKK